MDKTIKTTLCVAAAMLATGVKGETAMKTARLIYPQWQGARMQDGWIPEVKDMKECALCGTAAVLAPVGMVHSPEGDIYFPSGMDKIGEISGRIRETLLKIQSCEIEAPEGWIRRIV